MTYRCARRLVLDLREAVMPLVIPRPEGMSEKEWTDYHCAELSRLRQERNKRGDREPLNRGKVGRDGVQLLRG